MTRQRMHPMARKLLNARQGDKMIYLPSATGALIETVTITETWETSQSVVVAFQGGGCLVVDKGRGELVVGGQLGGVAAGDGVS